MHFSERAHPLDIVEVAADRPAARPRRLPSEPQAAGQTRAAAVGADHQPRAMLAPPAAPAHDDARHRARGIGHGAGRHDALVNLRASRDGALHQEGIELAARQRSSLHAATVAAANRHAARTGEHHTVEREPTRENRVDRRVPREHTQRARIQRVATELVAWKARPLEYANAITLSREDQRRQRTGRARARPR